MPSLPRDPKEHNLQDDINHHLANISITTQPVLITGVNRKANVGNFETVDVYAGLAIPLGLDLDGNFELLAEIVEKAAIYGFALTSKEVAERYQTIKNSTAPLPPPD